MTRGGWPLGIPYLDLGILYLDLGIKRRVVNRIARRWPLFGCGFIRYRRSLRSCRRRGSAATSPATAARLVGFAAYRGGAKGIGAVRSLPGGCARRFALYTCRGSAGLIVGRMRHQGVSSNAI